MTACYRHVGKPDRRQLDKNHAVPGASFRRLRTLATGQDGEDRLSATIEDHLARQTAENVRAGMTPRRSAPQACSSYGGIDAAKESWRDERRFPDARRSGPGHPLCVAAAADHGASVHARHHADTGRRHWSDDGNLHAGPRCAAEVAARRPRRARPCRRFRREMLLGGFGRIASSRWSRPGYRHLRDGSANTVI